MPHDGVGYCVSKRAQEHDYCQYELYDAEKPIHDSILCYTGYYYDTPFAVGFCLIGSIPLEAEHACHAACCGT